MALDPLAITKWSSRVLEQLRDAHVYKLGTNSDYEGEIKFADAVKIFTAPRFTTSAYTKTQNPLTASVTYQEISPAEQLLTIANRQYFAGSTDNLEKLIAMMGGKMWEEAIQGGAWELADDVDDEIASVMAAGVSATNVLAARTLGLGLNARAFDLLVDMKTAFQKANVPPNRRHVFVPPEFAGLLSKDDRFTGFNTPNASANIRGDLIYSGIQTMTLHETNNAPVSGTTYTIIAAWEGACTTAEQLNEIEYFDKFENSFNKGVRQEVVWGSKVTVPQGIVTCSVQFA